MDSLSLVLKRNKYGEDFYILMGNFLDEFYKADANIKSEMINEKPTEFKEYKEYLPFAAATAHKLANDYGLKCPDWVFEDDCYMKDKPFFACKAKGNLRLLFMYKSPSEFKHRNLFVDENVLKRV